jgi:hypothetical protein
MRMVLGFLAASALTVQTLQEMIHWVAAGSQLSLCNAEASLMGKNDRLGTRPHPELIEDI